MIEKFGQSGRFGSIGESLAREWLLNQGCWILPASLIDNGGAPMLQSKIRDVILPDLMAGREKITFWSDVKTKTQAVYFQKLKRFQTGCALRHIKAYEDVAQLSGIPASLTFVHLKEQKIFFQWLDVLMLGDPQFCGVKVGKFDEDMVFFGLERFDWFPIDRGKLLNDLKNHSVPPRTCYPWQVGKELPKEKPILTQGLLFGSTEVWRPPS